MVHTVDNSLATYLKDRRRRLDPFELGFSSARRRTPGLRREEVAQRANVSVTWYTWLEQGRGGSPSAEVVDRIAQALVLTEVEREHLFLLALGRPPISRRHTPRHVSSRLQRVLDRLDSSPAYIKTAIWDVVAWNRAAAAVLTDYSALEASQRNILRLVFCSPQVRAAQTDWETIARFVVAAFRADVVRAGTPQSALTLIEDLRRLSPEFEALWLNHDVRTHGEGTKLVRDMGGKLIELEYSSFVVDGEPDLSMVIYSPATDKDIRLVASAVARKSKTKDAE